MSSLLVDSAAFPYPAVRDAALRRAIREGSETRYALVTSPPAAIAWVLERGEPVEVLTTPDRHDVWALLLDPFLDRERWALEQMGVPRDKLSEVLKKSPEQRARSKKWGPFYDAAATHLRGMTTCSREPDWVPIERPEARMDRLYIVANDDLIGRIEEDAESMIALDFETEGDQADGSLRVIGFSYSAESGTAIYVPLAHAEGENVAAEPALGALRDITSGQWVAHNAQYELACLRSLGITPAVPPDDTMVLAWQRQLPKGLKKLALEVLGERMTTFAEVTDGRPFSQVPIAQAVNYAAADADMTLRLAQYFSANPHVNDAIYQSIDKPLVPILAGMTARGLDLDQKWLLEWEEQLTLRLIQIETGIAVLVGGKVNLASPAQVSALLFDELGLPPTRFTASGYATDDDALRQIKDQHPVVDLILQHRGVSKQRSTYAQGLLNVAHYAGVYRPEWDGTGTITGRLASRGPEMRDGRGKRVKGPQAQNIPYVARQAIVARPGHVLVAADYSQIELRILAHKSQDPRLLSAFREGRSPHLETMQLVFGTSDKHYQDGKPYKLSKNINFGIPYGAGPDRLVAQALEGGVVSDVEEQKRYLALHRENYATVWEYRERRIGEMRAQGWSESLQGFRVQYPELRSPDFQARSEAERQAFNQEIQGTSGRFTAAAMVAWYDDVFGAMWPIVLQVHDEIVIEVPEADAEAASRDLVEVMKGVAQPYLSIPVEVEASVGRNWRETK
ncbi:MAG: DNA polymerase [Gammaproteobacteria bacterium]